MKSCTLATASEGATTGGLKVSKYLVIIIIINLQGAKISSFRL